MDIAELEATPNHPMLDAYRTAVGKMIERSKRNPQDPLGWQAQAEIHQNRCPHGNWFFLPWHRAYLLAFEDICRQESGYADFALPYWDWVKNPVLPRAFLTAPLLDATRTFGANDRLTEGVFRPDVFQSDVMGLPEFERFGGEMRGQTANSRVDWQKVGGGEADPPAGVAPESGALESSPHNAVHRALGGNMGDLLSPLDPIFWLHHCNVDRNWVVWRQCSSNGQRHTNTTNTLWRNYSFNFGGKADFVGPDGRPRVYTVSQMESVNSLGYSYGVAGDCQATVVASASRGVNSRAAAPPVPQRQLARLDADWRSRARSVSVNREIKTSAPASFSLPPAAPSTRSAAPGAAAGRSTGANSFQLPTSGQIPSRVVAVLSDVVSPPDPDTVLRVFVNNKSANAQTPQSDASYVTSISFFGHGKAAAPGAAGGHAGHVGHGAHKMSFVVELNRALNAMKAAGRLTTGDIEIQLVPVNPKAGPGKDVSIQVGKVEIAGNRV